MTKKGRLDLWPWIVIGGQLLAGWRAEQNYQGLPNVAPLRDRSRDETLPGISVIVPARNEEANLARLLASLVMQDYPCYEIIVVDDASSDGTADVARQYAGQGVRLLSSAGPPAGWTGKNAACWLGANASHYPWLLFVDADVELEALALRSSLAFAREQDVHALSLFARQRCESFWGCLLLPFAYQQFFVGVDARLIHQTRGRALANGQYFLLERNVYQRVGGHAANAGSVIDDVALATTLKEHGIVPLACRGEQLVTVRMYSNLHEISEGFGKNSYLFLRKAPLTGVQTAICTWLAASVGVLFIRAAWKRSRLLPFLALVAYVLQVCGIQPWLRRAGVRPAYAFLTPLAALMFLKIALTSMLRVLTGRPLAWKGRSYRGEQKSQPRVTVEMVR
jgi:chlorobactene glucosyltransferase